MREWVEGLGVVGRELRIGSWFGVVPLGSSSFSAKDVGIEVPALPPYQN